MTESKGLAFTFCFFNHLYGHENKYRHDNVHTNTLCPRACSNTYLNIYDHEHAHVYTKIRYSQEHVNVYKISVYLSLATAVCG